MHLWSLAQGLLQRGHKVVVLTRASGARRGVRYMANGLKVYYLPLREMAPLGVAFPTFGLAWLPLFRHVVLREGVTVVHGHQATSCLAQEALLMARALGLRTVYTDHSLFGFADLGSVLINKVRPNAHAQTPCSPPCCRGDISLVLNNGRFKKEKKSKLGRCPMRATQVDFGSFGVLGGG